jgi:hypothetical protein
MSPLVDLQRRMASAVMQPITKTDRMARLDPRGRSNAKEAKQFIKPNSRLTSFERLEIYNRQYWFRILDSFAEDFPGLRAVVGRKRFDQIARSYLSEHPSTSFTLRNLGSRLPQWLSDHREFAGDRYSLAADMLKLEWAHIEAFDAADLTPLSAEALAVLGEDPLLTLQPHISLLEVQYPVDDLLLAVREHDREEEESGGNRAYPIRHWVKPSRRVAKNVSHTAQETIYIAVHRADYSVCYKRLEGEAYLLLTTLKERKPLSEALEIAFESSSLSPEEQAAEVQQYFAHWMALGWFTESHSDTSTDAGGTAE